MRRIWQTMRRIWQAMTGNLLLQVVAAALVVGGCAATGPAPVEERGGRTAKAAPKPEPRPAAAAPSAVVPEGAYVVKKGDTLYSIALEHGADYRDVAQWNRLEDPSKIQIGQMLRVSVPEQKLVEVGKPRVIGRVEARPLGEAAPKEPAAAPKPEPKAEPKVPPSAAEFIWPIKGKVLKVSPSRAARASISTASLATRSWLRPPAALPTPERASPGWENWSSSGTKAALSRSTRTTGTSW